MYKKNLGIKCYDNPHGCAYAPELGKISDATASRQRWTVVA